MYCKLSCYFPDIQQLVSLGLSLNHPGTSLITEQEKLVIVKQMVVKYKLGKSYNRQGSEAEKLLRGIFKNKQDLVALQDAVKVAEVLCGVEKKDAIRLYIEKLIEIDQHREGMFEFLRIPTTFELYPLLVEMKINLPRT